MFISSKDRFFQRMSSFSYSSQQVHFCSMRACLNVKHGSGRCLTTVCKLFASFATTFERSLGHNAKLMSPPILHDDSNLCFPGHGGATNLFIIKLAQFNHCAVSHQTLSQPRHSQTIHSSDKIALAICHRQLRASCRSSIAH